MRPLELTHRLGVGRASMDGANVHQAQIMRRILGLKPLSMVASRAACQVTIGCEAQILVLHQGPR